MDGRQVHLENNDESAQRTKIKRKNSVEEKVKMIDLQKNAGAEEEKFETSVPRKSSKEGKVLSPRFFVRSASDDKHNPPANNTNKIDYKKL